MASPSSKTAKPIQIDEFKSGDWKFCVTQSHIQKSLCTCDRSKNPPPPLSSSTEEKSNADAILDNPTSIDQETSPSLINRDESNSITADDPRCQLCRFELDLTNLTQLPEMIFADNSLTIIHAPTGARLSFDTLASLKSIAADHDPIVKVKASQQWLDSRKHCPFVKNTIKKPYDWTFTPRYGGTTDGFKAIEPTDEQIDLEQLKIREPILFYQELTLYEDELADNGTSQLTLKFRCMPSGYFALLRFYVRVDFVWTCVKDVRIHWRTDRPSYVLREFRTRQKSWDELDAGERALVLNPTELWASLKPVHEENRAEKLVLY